MMQTRLFIVVLFTGFLITACAGPAHTLKIDGVDKSITPASVVADLQTTRGRTVLWGGVIISSKNLATTTQLEVLAYPLDADDAPNNKAAPGIRFLLLKQGYLETATYEAGRRVTAVGKITGTRLGKVGESTYTYPTLQVSQLHLWPKKTQSTDPRIHFGIGIGISR